MLTLRLYSVYGPYEDASRADPQRDPAAALERNGYPEFVQPRISRDFVYVDDVAEAFLDAALNLEESAYGESFNIGTGSKTTIGDVAAISRREFGLQCDPQFTMPKRRWDVADWFANIDKAKEVIRWAPRTPFHEGLERTVQWYKALPDKQKYHQASKKFGLDTVYSVSAIVACYKDNQAIPIMYERLKNTFTKMNIDFEIIFVNDCSPDDSEEVIRAISRNDRRVIGISHSRNFGSQAAFVSGMRIATKNACVLLDGDLQDPPELIEQFVAEWRNGHDVVYGRRVKREATLFMQFAYKAFYRVFDRFSRIRVFNRTTRAISRLNWTKLASGAGPASFPRARPLSAWLPCVCRLQADRRGLRPAGADVWPNDQQPGEEPRLGEEGDSELQQHAAVDAQLHGHGVARTLPDLVARSGGGSHSLPRTGPARRDDTALADPVLRLDQPVRGRLDRRVHRQDFRGSQTASPVHPAQHHQGGRSTPGGGSFPSLASAFARPLYGDHAPMLTMHARACPVCGSTNESRVFAPANLDPAQMNAFSFASRKLPEYLHARLIECPTCDVVYANPAIATQALASAYEEAAFYSQEEAGHAARTYGSYLKRNLARLPESAMGAALDIGTGEGSFLRELLRAGFHDVVGVEPSRAPIKGAAMRMFVP